MTRLTGIIPKGWGSEHIWATNDKYCGKFMHFNEGACFSMHFHKEKEETWYIMSGEFQVRWITTHNAAIHSQKLKEGDTWQNSPLLPHQLICIKKGTVLEVSTADSVEDNYRIMPGDSQKK